MKRFKVTEYPVLRQVFRGYLHEDFMKEYGSAAAALRTFEDDADDDEVDRFRAEVRRFLEFTAPLDFAKVQALVTKIGGRWNPPSREEFVAALTGEPPAA